MMTPFQYAQNYWVLPVPMVSEANVVTSWDFVRVSKYRLADPTSAAGATETFDAMTTKSLNEFESKINPFDKGGTPEVTIYTKNNDGTVNTDTFTKADKHRLMRSAKRAIWGKGTPQECQITLQLVRRFGLAANIQQLQKYCDDGKIGLDCNGFVGTYARRSGQKSR